MQHKWAKEIKAWADGAEIEYKTPMGEWEDCDIKPDWRHDVAYRIKPQPKKSQYLYVWIPHDEEGETVITHQKPRGVLSDSVYKYAGKIKMEQDDE